MPLSSGTSFFPLPHIENTPRRVRVFFNGFCLVDTTSAKLVWQNKFYPNYFFSQTEWPDKGTRLTAVEDSKEKSVYQIEVAGKKAPGNLTRYQTGDLTGLFTISFDGMDWFEEDEQIFTQEIRIRFVTVLRAYQRGRSGGYTRASFSVRNDGARSNIHTQDRLPFEPSDLSLSCPYKGDANYYHVNLPSGEKVENVVWWYKAPYHGCDLIEGYVAFYDEKVDTWVDEQKQERPAQ